MTIGKRIKKLRKLADLTQRDVAYLSNVSERTIRKIEGEVESVTLSRYRAVLVVLGYHMEYILKKNKVVLTPIETAEGAVGNDLH